MHLEFGWEIFIYLFHLHNYLSNHGETNIANKFELSMLKNTTYLHVCIHKRIYFAHAKMNVYITAYLRILFVYLFLTENGLYNSWRVVCRFYENINLRFWFAKYTIMFYFFAFSKLKIFSNISIIFIIILKNYNNTLLLL